MYSIAQHAVANGYGKSENLRAQPTALSTVVRMTLSSSNACSSLPGLVSRSCIGNSDLVAFGVSSRSRGVNAACRGGPARLRIPACPQCPGLRSARSTTKRRRGRRRLEAQINLWAHLIAFAIYTGATVALVAVVLPVIAREQDPERRVRLAAGVLRIYDPLSIAALGVLIMT